MPSISDIACGSSPPTRRSSAIVPMVAMRLLNACAIPRTSVSLTTLHASAYERVSPSFPVGKCVRFGCRVVHPTFDAHGAWSQRTCHMWTFQACAHLDNFDRRSTSISSQANMHAISRRVATISGVVALALVFVARLASRAGRSGRQAHRWRVEGQRGVEPLAETGRHLRQSSRRLGESGERDRLDRRADEEGRSRERAHRAGDGAALGARSRIGNASRAASGAAAHARARSQRGHAGRRDHRAACSS